MAGEMIQQVKVFATKPGDMNSILKPPYLKDIHTNNKFF